VRDSADSYDPAFGRIRKANNKRQRNRFDDQETFVKRDRHVKRLATAETAADATDGLADGERWSTWDQSKNSNSNDANGGTGIGGDQGKCSHLLG
jgi:hypothetical protein